MLGATVRLNVYVAPAVSWPRAVMGTCSLPAEGMVATLPVTTGVPPPVLDATCCTVMGLLFTRTGSPVAESTRADGLLVGTPVISASQAEA